MTYIVKDECIKCKLTDCVEVCPVDCFYEGPNFLVINPDECIDCGACVPECPVGAIFEESEVPEKWDHYIDYNEKMAQIWPNIFDQQDPHPECEKYQDVDDKSDLLNEDPP